MATPWRRAAALALLLAGPALAASRGPPSLSELAQEFVVADELEFIREDEQGGEGRRNSLASVATSFGADLGDEEEGDVAEAAATAEPEADVAKLAARQGDESHDEPAQGDSPPADPSPRQAEVAKPAVQQSDDHDETAKVDSPSADQSQPQAEETEDLATLASRQLEESKRQAEQSQADLTKLASQQAQQSQRQAAIVTADSQEASHLQDGAKLQGEIARLRAKARLEDKVLQKLEAQHQHLEADRKGLDARLRSVVAPRVALQKRRVARQQKAEAKVREEQARWEQTFGKRRAAALALLKERKAAKDSLEAAEKAAAEAERAVLKARSQLDGVRDQTAREIEAVKFARTKLEAKSTEVQDAVEQTREAERSLHRIEGILGAEEQRISKALDKSEAKNAKRTQAAEAEKASVVQLLGQTEQAFVRWQAQRRSETEQVQKLHKQWEVTQQTLDDARLQADDGARARAGAAALAAGGADGGDWAWSGAEDGDES